MAESNNDYIKGLVSVIIPTYKRAELICRTIDSVLNQSYEKIECIVVNDNEKASDESIILRETIGKYFSDDRFIFIEQDRHINGAVARNVGIKKARGEYISFLDDDDYWEKDKLIYQVNFLNAHNEEWGAVTCYSKLVNNGKLLRASVPFNGGNLLKKILYRRIGIGTGPTLIRHKAIDLTSLFDENLRRHQDLQFFSEIAFKYKIGVIKKHLCVIDNKNTINKPTISQLLGIKESYYKSIKNILDTLNKRELKRFYIMHNFELAYSYFTNGNKKDAFRCAFSIFKSPLTFFYAVERVCNRVFGKLFRNLLIKRY